jgi:hypothetical protein
MKESGRRKVFASVETLNLEKQRRNIVEVDHRIATIIILLMYLAMTAIDKTPIKHFSARFKSPGSTKSDATTLFNASSKPLGRRTQEKASHVTFQATTDTPSPFNPHQPHLAAFGSDIDDSEKESPRQIQASISSSPPQTSLLRPDNPRRSAMQSSVPSQYSTSKGL